MRRTLRFTVPPEYDSRKALQFLRGFAGLSSRLMITLKNLPDGIACNGAHIRTIDRVHAGDRIVLTLPEEAGEIEPIPIPLDVIYEDADLLVINKPAGLAMHPTHNHQGDTLANGVAAYLARNGENAVFRAVGRLDKCTSGVVICAKNAFAASALGGKLKKTYLALPSGRFEGCGAIEKRIYRPDPMKTLRAAGDEGEYALTRWESVLSGDRCSLVRVLPETGRTHQIRVHFASLGAPLLGDDMYGGSRELIARAALHCAEVRLTHPVSEEEMCFSAPLPEDMTLVIQSVLTPKGQNLMKKFMDKDFLLATETAKKLFAACKDEPIFDWHCHLSPKEIYENKTPADLTELWLAGDHYKWRAMRSLGISEKYITGDAPSYEKFKAWAGAMPYLIGNPLYHWTHLELQRYFGIEEPLSPKTCDLIWNKSKEMIAAGGFEPRTLIEKSNVVCVATTDDPADSLEYHKLIAADAGFKCKVIPAYRPDKAIAIENPTFVPWLKALSQRVGREISSYAEMKAALCERMDFFKQMGCRASDQALAAVPFVSATEAELAAIFAKGAAGEALTEREIDAYKTDMLIFLGREYHKRGFAMELHIGAMRNNNTAMFRKLGPDTGYDSIDDLPTARGLSRVLDALAVTDQLPKTILFTLNPIMNYMLGSMLGNFQNDDAVCKIQFGSGWWFNDNIDGMNAQLRAFMNLGAVSKFVGMITDSRSFLSYPRHEYFRRILCNLIGEWVEDGEFPADPDALAQIVMDICYNNTKEFFRF